MVRSKKEIRVIIVLKIQTITIRGLLNSRRLVVVMNKQFVNVKSRTKLQITITIRNKLRSIFLINPLKNDLIMFLRIRKEKTNKNLMLIILITETKQ